MKRLPYLAKRVYCLLKTLSVESALYRIEQLVDFKAGNHEQQIAKKAPKLLPDDAMNRLLALLGKNNLAL